MSTTCCRFDAPKIFISGLGQSEELNCKCSYVCLGHNPLFHTTVKGTSRHDCTSSLDGSSGAAGAGWLLDVDGEALVEGGDADGLLVQVAVVAHAVLVGQVQRVGREGLRAAALLQQEGGVVAGHGPGDV